MSANRLYLVCTHHTNPEEALLLGERASYEAGYTPSKYKNARDWFDAHAACGRTRDHFALAYGHPADWDIDPPAEDTVAGQVKLAVAINGAH